MSPHFFISLLADSTLNWSSDDTWIVITACLCSVACALLGNFLVLRRMSMLGDAITHAVLPGLAVAFLISESRTGWPMFLGAVVVGVLTAFFTQWIRDVGNVDEGASMGVVFTSLFALGLVLIVRAADSVDLDPGCVLYGAIEVVPFDMISIAGFEVPQATWNLTLVTLVNLAFVILFFKELRISSFDPALATTSGFNATFMHYLLVTLVAITAVACFESVGSVLVVAMLIVPPATALLLTTQLRTMIVLSVIIAIGAAIAGHTSAIVVPRWFDFRSTTTAGMIAVSAGAFLFGAACFGPSNGIVVRFVRHRLLSLNILEDDIVALLFRRREQQASATASERELREWLLTGRVSLAIALLRLHRRGEITRDSSGVTLTQEGSNRGQSLVRSHRLWEQYLQDFVGIAKERVHPQAERLEHFTNQMLRDQLSEETAAPAKDPHGSPIPEEVDS